MCSVGDVMNLGVNIKVDGPDVTSSNPKEKLKMILTMKNICIIYKVTKIIDQ